MIIRGSTQRPASSTNCTTSLAAYDFDLPTDLIAGRPIEPRDAARMLVVGTRFEDRKVRDLPRLLRRGDVLVCNDTRVIPARLEGFRGKARVQLTILGPNGPLEWRALARPAKKLRIGDRVRFGDNFSGHIVAKGKTGEVTLRFAGDQSEFDAQLRAHGTVPLPPYIKRPADERDVRDYQTIFAKNDGAIAAPTAGLHFTQRLLEDLATRGINLVNLTLHVGAGTFLPVKVEDLREHRMHAEHGIISSMAADVLNKARDNGGRIVAVGTTSLRLLESAADNRGRINAFDDWTDIFIYPGYEFRTADLLMTNFHLPKSTLFVLVSAFAGLERMRRAYTHAIASRYRFYSYGDACLLYREKT